MNDGFHGIESGTDPLPSEGVTVSVPYAHATRAKPGKATPEACLAAMAEWLPRLGPVLWLERGQRATNRPDCPRLPTTMLLDHPALMVLSACRQMRAHQAITAQGPREWISFASASGAVDAKLYLLPDSNVLAWDEMNSTLSIDATAGDCGEAPSHSAFLWRALSRLGQSWQARLLEFRCIRRPWLSVLDARPPLRISLLGIDIARGIVRDEHAEWISPLHLS